jgi:hypothetical protein
MDQSILNSTKKILGIGPDDTSFDLDVMTYINSAFFNLHQLGIGPVEGFEVEDDRTEWADFGIDSLPMLHQLKTCVYLRARMMFDPPSTSYLLQAMERQVVEAEWRLNQMREETGWVDPDPPEALMADG